MKMRGADMILNVIPRPNCVVFTGGECWAKENKIVYKTDSSCPEEFYSVEIKNGETVITSKGEKGAYYAALTLEQLYEMGKVPNMKIVDLPAYEYRGFMIDSARHMQTVDEIKAYITAAARYKFNTFHWHLSDDQGFRIEIEKYPLLNEKASYRDCHGFKSENNERYGGYYTKKEIKEIVDFCEKKHIRVIPELDMPGHTVAMISAYPHLSCRGEQIPVQTKGGIFKDILCAGNEDVFEFCYNLLDEIIELFPCEYIHIGGDEAPKARWCACEKCQQRIKDENLNSEEELQGYFTNRIISYLKNKGKKAIAWNESLKSGIVDGDTIICQWMDKNHQTEQYANNGGKMIAEDFYHYYLDYEYGMTSLKKTYSYNPQGSENFNWQGRKNVWGVETPIWTEYIEDFERMSYMCFPRLIAVAETGWTREKHKDYKSFKIRAEGQRDFLSSIGINMAQKKCWDPDLLTRAKVMTDRLKSILDPEMISATLFPNRDD